MLIKKTINKTVKLSLAIIFIGSAMPVFADIDSPPVMELKELLKENAEASSWLEKALEEAKELPDGSSNPWRDKSFEDVFAFLNGWYYFLPEKHNGLDKIMEFSLLYFQNPYGLKFINQEPGLSWSKRFVEHRGKYLDSKDSLAGVDLWMNDKSISNDDFVEPEGGYQSFNEYFVRELKPGRRPVSAKGDGSIITSPADCIIARIANQLEAESSIPTKGKMSLNLSQLLDGSEYAQKFIGGSAYSCFLMPDNYHHYHSPVEGKVVESSEHVGSKLFGIPDLIDMVNKGDPGHNKDFSVFEDFKHGYLIIETLSLGYVAMVPIGLQTVGSVVFEEKFKNVSEGAIRKIDKGEKVGHFAYGGSTVLLFFEKGRFNALSVKQGQRIGHAN